ncbi:MAG: Gfo/Idh/MocA family oxidoreductase [Chitinophagaceae bacterium]|nr:Gfo/Idh/MocA family oxidoreductase [Chitinophagaceae bacterium]
MPENASPSLRVGIVGAGNQSRKHTAIFRLAPGVVWHGVYDVDTERARTMSAETGIQAFTYLEDLLHEVDIVYIATNTASHFPLAQMAIMAGKHVLIEKPATENAEQTQRLINMAAEANVQCMVAYSGRFNPAWTSVRYDVKRPLFIESHHLVQFNDNEISSNVVNDLMQHDLDIILPLVNSEIKRISATGVKVAHDTPDIANARLEFANGCVVNLTASRISLKPLWKMRIFEPNAYHYLDFVGQKADFVSLKEQDQLEEIGSLEHGARNITLHQNIRLRLESKPQQAVEPMSILWGDFIDAVRNDKHPRVTLPDVYKVMETAERIIKKINSLGDE